MPLDVQVVGAAPGIKCSAPSPFCSSRMPISILLFHFAPSPDPHLKPGVAAAAAAVHMPPIQLLDSPAPPPPRGFFKAAEMLFQSTRP